jgi:hypothetical protein
MGFFSFLKYTFVIFAAHLATSCGAPFENHWLRVSVAWNWKGSFLIYVGSCKKERLYKMLKAAAYPCLYVNVYTECYPHLLSYFGDKTQDRPTDTTCQFCKFMQYFLSFC